MQASARSVWFLLSRFPASSDVVMASCSLIIFLPPRTRAGLGEVNKPIPLHFPDSKIGGKGRDSAPFKNLGGAREQGRNPF